jgi:hypothetical protein
LASGGGRPAGQQHGRRAGPARLPSLPACREAGPPALPRAAQPPACCLKRLERARASMQSRAQRGGGGVGAAACLGGQAELGSVLAGEGV